ncbi:FAD-dependent thymidylate synthase, partial [Candidatus Woesearchaeota archaeon]|nr:FAD-dependent thymidylate synthase [Candidatus Woesearchaeota archaeon]
DQELKEICDRSNELYYEFLPRYGKDAEYCLTDAHRRRDLLATNLRQLYHISRTREDSHAQWEIRAIAEKMSALAQEVAPATSILLGGKDKFGAVKARVYDEKQ